jgi:hypothetical protein
MFGNSMMMGGGLASPSGQQSFTTLGNTSFVVPEGVNSICAVAIGMGLHGGGALSYSNDIPVTAGETLTITLTNTSLGFTSLLRGATTLLRAQNGASYSTRAASAGGSAGNGVGDVKFSGGNSGGTTGTGTGQTGIGGGGGAAGYHSAGGSGTWGTSTSTGDSQTNGGGGGGVGLLGGASQTAPTGGGGGRVGEQGGIGAYGGANGVYRSHGGNFGGGSGTGALNSPPVNGAVRIIWGSGRSYPLNAGNV